MTNNDVFDPEEIVNIDFRDIIDPEEIVNIDLDGIGEESKAAALEMIEDISKFYYNESFLKEHPAFKKRVDAELESLRINIKMRKADEVAMDILIKKVAADSANGSMYIALTTIQKTILSITTKIDDIIARLNNMMKGYQLELNFEPETPEEEEAQKKAKPSHRGTKSFIEAMADADMGDVDIPEED